jgi:aspartate/methionine/tyrosine aminotransferase
MFELKKSYVIGEDQQPIAVQIPIEQFQQIEEILENYGLAKLMDEPYQDAVDAERLNPADAQAYYQHLKQAHVES